MSHSHDPRRELNFGDFTGESDRGIAIIGAAWLDSCLEACLQLCLRKPENGQDKLTKDTVAEMFQPEGPLGSFSARCKMAHLLKVIGPATFKDLKIINAVRNEFAHYIKAENPHRRNEIAELPNTESRIKSRG